MTIEIRVPQLPESVSDATLVNWHRSPGDPVRRDEKLVELETDKVVLEVPSPSDGILQEVRVADGATVTAGEVLALLEPGEASGASDRNEGESAAEGSVASEVNEAAAPEAAPVRESSPPAFENEILERAGPAVRRLMREHRVDSNAVRGTGRGGRITKSDVLDHIGRGSDAGGGRKQDVPAEAQDVPGARVAPSAYSAASTPSTERSPSTEGSPPAESSARTESFPGTGSTSSPQRITSAPALPAGHRDEQRVPMTRLRARISERLVEAQHTAAMLTTFNEVDTSTVMAARSRYGEVFQRTHEVKLGFMSFFIKASIEALRRFPVLNASVDGTDIIYHDYFDIGVAVSTERGLVVPILRNAERMSYADIEKSIVDFGTRARTGGLGMQDLTGGTFTLTNGGIFGSMMSTPIINPPQSGILGMHSIQQRPVVVDGEIEVRPMMYLALTYDHRIVDGREAVHFLVAIKDLLEDPARLLLQV